MQPLPITDREREIAVMVAAGLSNRQIADRLSVSVRTVDGHLYRIFAKLDIQSREQLARLLGGSRSGT
ncbi:bacterial regulatory s, luxR family protein [Mycobacterium xenopi 4042]|uniref:Bacterial regulatory s, luxR family protein n=1 Tax=Mycobacterium xenopi 4042 TaxID=1299334 RepID=X8BGM6_MYCXE|nr:bacterial regulatory s, luxR family protein [Mycobacterium xenopi 4042]